MKLTCQSKVFFGSHSSQVFRKVAFQSSPRGVFPTSKLPDRSTRPYTIMTQYPASGVRTRCLDPKPLYSDPKSVVRCLPMDDDTGPPKTDNDNVVEFIPAAVYEREIEGGIGPLTNGQVEKELNRRSVTHNILNAFEMVGGVPRLASWANDEENYSDFIKMYARLAPSAQHDDGGGSTLTIHHVIPRGKLDELPDPHDHA